MGIFLFQVTLGISIFGSFSTTWEWDLHDIEKSNSTFENEDQQADFLLPGLYPKHGDMPALNRKIFQGYRVSISEHPYIVSIRRNYAHILVGALLSRTLVITVAHPIHDVAMYELSVVVGESYADRGSILLTVVTMIVHDSFDQTTHVNDIALLLLYKNLGHAFSVKPLVGIWGAEYSFKDTTAFVTGWGRCDMTGYELCFPRSSLYNPEEYLDPMLKTIKIPMWMDDNATGCDTYLAEMDVPLAKHRDKMLCAGVARALQGMAPCMAVPGAPLVIEGRILGLTSWGYGCGYTNDLPLVFTDLRYYNKWIQTNLKVSDAIEQANISTLFEATKSVKMWLWIQYSRGIPLNLDLEWSQSEDEVLKPLSDDENVLSKFDGMTFDIRDSLGSTELAAKKQAMLSSLRSVYSYTVNEDATTQRQWSTTQGERMRLLLAHYRGAANSSSAPLKQYYDHTNRYQDSDYGRDDDPYSIYRT